MVKGNPYKEGKKVFYPTSEGMKSMEFNSDLAADAFLQRKKDWSRLRSFAGGGSTGGYAVKFEDKGNTYAITCDTKDQAELIYDAIDDFKQGLIKKGELMNTLESYESDLVPLSKGSIIEKNGKPGIVSEYYEKWIPFYTQKKRRGGYLYEVSKSGESQDLKDRLMSAKNLKDLKEKVVAKYGTTKGVSVGRKSAKTGAFYQVNFEGGGGIGKADLNEYGTFLYSILEANNWKEPTEKEFPRSSVKRAQAPFFEDVHFVWRQFPEKMAEGGTTGTTKKVFTYSIGGL